MQHECESHAGHGPSSEKRRRHVKAELQLLHSRIPRRPAPGGRAPPGTLYRAYAELERRIGPHAVADTPAASGSDGRPRDHWRRARRPGRPHRPPDRTRPSPAPAPRMTRPATGFAKTDEERTAEGPGDGRRPGEGAAPLPRHSGACPMTLPDTISADYTLRPAELAATLKVLVEARQPRDGLGARPAVPRARSRSRSPPRAAAPTATSARFSSIPSTCAASPGATRDNRTRWGDAGTSCRPAPAPALYLVNLEETPPPGVPMVQAALFQLVRDRKCGEYELPEGRLDHGLRQPRQRRRHHPPHADPAGVALRSPRDQGRRARLVRLGGGQRPSLRRSSSTSR